MSFFSKKEPLLIRKSNEQEKFKHFLIKSVFEFKRFLIKSFLNSKNYGQLD